MEISSVSSISHLLHHRPQKIESLGIDPEALSHNFRLRKLEEKAKENSVRVFYREKKGAEPVIAQLPPFEYTDLKSLLETLSAKPRSLLVMLDHLQDPQNFGAIVRSAEGLGADGILIPKDRSVSVTPGVYHASVGAVETVPICQIGNVGNILRKLKEERFWAIGASHGAHSKVIDEMPDFERVVLVLGAEGDGLSEHTEKLCDWLVRIPMKGHIESLNVSVSAAILMYEICRRSSASRATDL